MRGKKSRHRDEGDEGVSLGLGSVWVLPAVAGVALPPLVVLRGVDAPVPLAGGGSIIGCG